MRDALKGVGWDADFLVVNSIHSHLEWLRANAARMSMLAKTRFIMALALSRFFSESTVNRRLWPWLAEILIESTRPDIVYIFSSSILHRRSLNRIRKIGIVPVLQQSASAPNPRLLAGYRAMVSCLRWLTDYASGLGLSSLHLRLVFDLNMREERLSPDRDIDVSFVGSVTPVHPITVPLLQAVARRVPGLEIYGPPSKAVLSDPLLSKHYRGEAWGQEMLGIFRRSKVTLNRHGDVLGDEAGNYRLYEATACGAALVTDRMKFLEELFVPGEEVEVYDTPGQAADVVAALLEDEKKRTELAKAGEVRTMSDHSIQARMEILSEFLQSLLREERERRHEATVSPH
jgi:glycosyltransferase involved in cell wall biosynthesis